MAKRKAPLQNGRESDTKGVRVEIEAENEEEDYQTSIVPLNAVVKKAKKAKLDAELSLCGQPIPFFEARQKWPLRYDSKNKTKMGVENLNGQETQVLQAKSHYKQAMVDGVLYSLGDHAYVKAEDDSPDYIARIVELFETIDGEPYFTAQWFYRIEDTVIKQHAKTEESRRVFLSDIKDDNPLNCIVSKIKLALVDPNLDLDQKKKNIPECDLYYDMKYSLPFLSFSTIKTNDSARDSGSSSTISSDNEDMESREASDVQRHKKSELQLLDLYSGCGAMSTGLCMGASLSGVKLVTRWAVDLNENACKSLAKNHPETEVRNESAEDFLSLLKEWKKLCRKFSLFGSETNVEQGCDSVSDQECEEENDDDTGDDQEELSSEDFEVERLTKVCYGEPDGKKRGLYFKVRWKGYGSSDDTWEPVEGLSNCMDKLEEFVRKGYHSNILPLPGSADFICGGPPCQGISGFNRFRNKDDPLADPKNHQLVVFMDIVDYLKPRYVLMENVVDILKFAGGLLGRYALGRLASMNYQARFGIMPAGSYGLPQFRLRAFLWGAQPQESLPGYPLPTHEVVARGGVPTEFEEITVAYNKNHPPQLEKALCLGDAISDLPEVKNDESQDERKYGTTAKTEFQKYIRLKRNDVINVTPGTNQNAACQMLYDHQPYKLNSDDYERVCQIPKKKGANFRDLPGVLVGPDNKVKFDDFMERKKVSSGKYLVPDYAMKFMKGRSLKPFGRLWWDETVATVVTRAEPHNQVILHPAQDRVLTIRENARLQGFPDCYKLYGSIKERYIQVGNAVAVPVAIALGCAFGVSVHGLSDDIDKPLMSLPFKFPQCLKRSTQVQGEGHEFS